MPSIAEPYTPGCIYAGDGVEEGLAEGGSRHPVGAVKFRKWTRKQGRPVSSLDRTSGIERLSNPSSLRPTTHRLSVRDVALSTFLCIRLLALLSLAALAQVYGGTPARPATPWAAVSKEVTDHLLPVVAKSTPRTVQGVALPHQTKSTPRT